MKLLLMLILATAVVQVQANDEAPKASIITSMSNVVRCISPVEVTKIDGVEVRVNRLGFDLEPGLHTLRGRTMFVTGTCPALRGNERLNVAPLEYQFEAGVSYYIGLDHSARNRKEWHYTVWKVES
jgi:hypothetical protein